MEQKHIAVIGGGAAGLAAAVTAAEAGAAVEIFEALAVTGGNGRFAEGVFGVGSRLQQRLGIYADGDELFRYAMDFSHGRADGALTRALIDASGETVDWLCEEGVPFRRVIHHMINQSPELFHMTDTAPTGKHVVEALQRRCDELGVITHTSCRIAALLQDAGGRVIGLRDEAGREHKADGVFMATGGFAGSDELMRRLIPGIRPENIFHFRGIRHQGDGLLMAEKAGAAIDSDIAIEGAGPVFVRPGPIGALVRSPEVLWVNLQGRRFADESRCEDFIFGFNALARQPEQRCWTVFDDGCVARALAAPPSPMAEPAAEDSGLGGLPAALEQALACGDAVCGDTPRELAEKCGLDAAELEETLEHYNADCVTGRDRGFAKARRFMRPLTEGRLYAARSALDMISTHGGIRIDSHMRVLDTNYAPIPGLYAAGVDVSGIDAGDYSVWLCGHAFGFSLTGGRLAAGYMLKEK